MEVCAFCCRCRFFFLKPLYYTCHLVGTFVAGALCAGTRQIIELLDQEFNTSQSDVTRSVLDPVWCSSPHIHISKVLIQNLFYPKGRCWGAGCPCIMGMQFCLVEESFTADCLSITDKIIIFLDSKRKMKSSVPLCGGKFQRKIDDFGGAFSIS